MTVIRPGRGVHLVADKELTHAGPHYQGGMVGIAQKQDEPHSFDSLASRTKIASGVTYFLLTKGETELPLIEGAEVGSPVYIDTSTDALTLEQEGNVPFGRVTNLSSTFGTRPTHMRVDMDLKDNIGTTETIGATGPKGATGATGP